MNNCGIGSPVKMLDVTYDKLTSLTWSVCLTTYFQLLDDIISYTLHIILVASC